MHGDWEQFSVLGSQFSGEARALWLLKQWARGVLAASGWSPKNSADHRVFGGESRFWVGDLLELFSVLSRQAIEFSKTFKRLLFYGLRFYLRASPSSPHQAKIGLDGGPTRFWFARDSAHQKLTRLRLGLRQSGIVHLQELNGTDKEAAEKHLFWRSSRFAGCALAFGRAEMSSFNDLRPD